MPLGDLSPQASVALGVIVGLISTCVQSVGLTLQRKSHMLEDSKEEHLPRRAPYRRRRWQVGMFLFLIANIIGSTIQITTLPLPLLSTLQASGLVFNSILASLLLKEPWTWRTALGTALVVIGAFLISWFSALPEPPHNLEQLMALLAQAGFLVWFILSLVFTLGVLVATFFLQYCIPAQKRQGAKIDLVRGMSYGLISGILSAHALLLAKSAVELIVRSVADKVNQFSNYRSWLLLLAFLFLALTQLYFLHRGLKLVSTSILYPFVFCIYNIVAILDGLIYFRQTDRLPPLHAGIIALGTVILLAGVLMLSWLQDASETDPDDERHLVKTEIPQTVLTPGLGFVGDPEESNTDESAVSSDDEAFPDIEGTAGEDSALLSDHRRSSATTRCKSFTSDQLFRKRKRASTLKELRHIWSHKSDSDDDEGEWGSARYGTFSGRARSNSGIRRSAPSIQQHMSKTRRKSVGHDSHIPAVDAQEASVRNDDVEVGIDDNGEDEASLREPFQRANTMPNPEEHGQHRRRRSTARQRHGSGALFSDMLRAEWWNASRRGNSRQEGDESREAVGAGEEGGSRPRSRESRGHVRFSPRPSTEGEGR
ncbi:hypothetical protein K431DRAFT_303265 [Polychaeton citri CBS 116435]|uniref:DUF803-domain-containing protein n=1 Tax=Polychaeton citri CBS 116435 TaxID=1314669 RepID=A0A9P4UPF4_9PEZI|nr:hypothetical protein K431DRAFT_303265 [Polychaeton citri CBS 116435]